MNAIPKNVHILRNVFIAGFTGLTLRAVLYRIGFDDKGLLPAFHPLHMACLLLTIAVTVCLVLQARSLGGSNDRESNFPASLWRFAGSFAGGGMLLFSAFGLTCEIESPLDLARTVLAFCCSAAMLIAGYAPLTGRRPRFGLYVVVCVYFALDMICRYQVWSGNPQLPDYCFHILANVFLVLSAYHRIAFEVGMGRRRMHIFCSLMAAFLCMLSLIGPDKFEFYLGGGLWAASSMCTLDPPAEAPGEPEELQDVSS